MLTYQKNPRSRTGLTVADVLKEGVKVGEIEGAMTGDGAVWTLQQVGSQRVVAIGLTRREIEDEAFALFCPQEPIDPSRSLENLLGEWQALRARFSVLNAKPKLTRELRQELRYVDDRAFAISRRMSELRAS